MKLKRFFANIGLNKKIFFLFFGILLTALFTIWMFIYIYFQKLTSKSLEYSVQNTVHGQAERVNDFFWRADTLGNLLNTETPNFYSEIKDTTDVFVQYRMYTKLLEKLEAFCQSSLGQDILYQSFLVLPEEFPISHLLSSLDEKLFHTTSNPISSVRIINDSNFKTQAWYQTTQTLNGETYWFMYPDNTHIIWLSTHLGDYFLINSNVEYYSLGTLLIGIDISWITEQLDNNPLLNVAKIFITDSYNRIIFAEDTSLINANWNDLTQSTEDANRILLQAEPHHLWEQQLPGNMLLNFCVPMQTYNMHLTNGLAVFMALFLVVLLIGLGMTAFFSHWITLPLRNLSAHMKSSTLLTPITHHYKTNDEVTILYNTFNEMIDKIDTYSQEQQRLHYQLLQAQINPHFLYNTLDSVGCAALLHGEAKLCDVLSSLTHLMRYNINQPEMLVTLENELDMVKDYIAIQQFRYDDALSYTCSAAPETMKCRLPKTIIQPLVENSILYGCTAADGYRHVKVQVILNSESSVAVPQPIIHINISNHLPKNTDIEALAMLLNQYLQGTCELQRKNSGLGVRNVQNRIQMTFGKPYGIQYKNQENEITARISIPLFE